MDTATDVKSMEAFFARRVKLEREARGLSQAGLSNLLRAKGLRVHPTTIARIEDRNRARPRTLRLDEAAALAEVFNTTIDDLIGSDREVDPEAAYLRVQAIAGKVARTIESELDLLDRAIQDLPIHSDRVRQLAELAEDEAPQPDDLPLMRATLMFMVREQLRSNVLDLLGTLTDAAELPALDEVKATEARRELAVQRARTEWS